MSLGLLLGGAVKIDPDEYVTQGICIGEGVALGVPQPIKKPGKVRLDDGKFGKFSVRLGFGTSLHFSQTSPRRSELANNHEQAQRCLQSAFIRRLSA
jgi:hypothetical protein